MCLKRLVTDLNTQVPVTGEVITQFSKPWNANTDGCLDIVMQEYDAQPEEIKDSMGDAVEGGCK